MRGFVIMQKNIKKIKYYECGYCINNLGRVFKGIKNEKRIFNAGVFLIEHEVYGNILFDTGYSTKIYDCGLIGKLYNLFNPTFVKKEDMIDFKLRKDDINDVNYIILSHLHPDHIGGLSKFKNAKIIISEKAYKRCLNPKLKDLILKQLLPNWFYDNLIILSKEQLEENQTKYFKANDLFGDGSIMLTNLDGHAYGQICALINENIFLGADTSWGVDLINKSQQMKFIARMVQNDYKKYVQVNDILKCMMYDGVKLLFSHDRYESKEFLV